MTCHKLLKAPNPSHLLQVGQLHTLLLMVTMGHVAADHVHASLTGWVLQRFFAKVKPTPRNHHHPNPPSLLTFINFTRTSGSQDLGPMVQMMSSATCCQGSKSMKTYEGSSKETHQKESESATNLCCQVSAFFSLLFTSAISSKAAGYSIGCC